MSFQLIIVVEVQEVTWIFLNYSYKKKLATITSNKIDNNTAERDVVEYLNRNLTKNKVRDNLL